MCSLLDALVLDILLDESRDKCNDKQENGECALEVKGLRKLIYNFY
jgi:hypothetical protein